MHSIEIFYLLASGIAIVAMAPQIKQLVVSRSSDELSLFSWSAWALSQMIALAYSVSVGLIPYIIVSSTWVAFYVTMVVLIIRFRKARVAVAVTPTPEIGVIKDTV